ncbi:MAG: cytosine deaminase [Cyanobacteria bacterium P01_H01_bin.121]
MNYYVDLCSLDNKVYGHQGAIFANVSTHSSNDSPLKAVLKLPQTSHYWLTNAQVAHVLLAPAAPISDWRPNTDGLVTVNLEIKDGKIRQILPAQAVAGALALQADVAQVDLRQGQVWPCFVDLHTHLDKGHVWPRCPNPDGLFDSAIATIQADAAAHWQPDELYQRMSFGLRCSYAQGTAAIRTHLDSAGDLAALNWEVFQTVRAEWQDRITLQGVCLVTGDYYLTPAGEALADRVAAAGGSLGAVLFRHPDLDRILQRLMQLAQDRHLDLDLHVDESDNPADQALYYTAQAAIRLNFTGSIVCGHCCSLALQSPVAIASTIDLVKQAGIGIVSLPQCNLFLQGRTPQQTPRWRGITLIQELQAAGVPVAVASDNCRDPFHAYGDHDVLDVFRDSVRIGQLDRPFGQAPALVTRTPAQLMGLKSVGTIAVGAPADLVLFRGRSFSELLSRSQHDRVVLRHGQPIDRTLPDYAELDSLFVSDCG